MCRPSSTVRMELPNWMGVSWGGCCGAPDRPPAPCPTQLHPWESQTVLHSRWAEHSFPENKKENRGSPALCVSGNFQGKQRVFGAPFWKLASFPESESWSGAKSDAKLRKSARYPGGRRVFSRYTRGFPGARYTPAKYPGILPIWLISDLGPKPASDSAHQSPGN